MNSLFSGDTPAAPLAISSTVSLVDMQPSVSSRSKVIAVADRSAASSSADVSTASVVSTHSMVASPGASIPAPLAIPPMVQAAEGAWAEGAWAEGAWAEGAWAEGAWAEGAWAEGAWAEGAWAEGAWAGGAWGGRPPEATERRKAIFTTVSVVLIASAAASPPAREASATAASTPGRSLSIGSRSPIRPVEQTAISPAPTSPSAAARCSAVACVSWKPSGPVQALAPPELSTTARTRPPLTTWRVQVTGAACTRLVVNTAAADHEGPSFRTTATSGWPDCFSPAVTPAARKPSGAVTLKGTLRVWSGRRSPAGRA